MDTLPLPGTLRLLIERPSELPAPLEFWWHHDRSLREWVTDIGRLHQTLTTVSGDTILAAIPEPAAELAAPLTALSGDPILVAASTDLFYANQRARWRALKAFNRWRTRIWRRRPQCNIDLIENTPVQPADAVYLTDTRNRTVFCFHHRDLFNTFLSKITASTEMLPTPHPPTNPWTNEPLTLGQIIGVCQAYLQHCAARGRCPPILFAAYYAARYDLQRFESENSAMLAQHAIAAYFKDLHEHNRETVIDTALELLRDATARYSAVAFRRWMRQTPVSSLHREWLALVRDYTMHLNLHIQPRRHWHVEDAIYTDVRRLLHRTPLADPTGPRLRMLRTVTPPTAGTLSPLSMALLTAAVAMAPMPAPTPAFLPTTMLPLWGALPAVDASGADADDVTAAALLMLFQQTLDGGLDFPDPNQPQQ